LRTQTKRNHDHNKPIAATRGWNDLRNRLEQFISE
jgi:hypothetical protein